MYVKYLPSITESCPLQLIKPQCVALIELAYFAVAASAESFDNRQTSSTNYGPGANRPLNLLWEGCFTAQYICIHHTLKYYHKQV